MAPGANPLHRPSPPGVRWTTTNFGEALTGVPTPLSWSFWEEATNRGAWYAYGETGLFSKQELAQFKRDGVVAGTVAYGHYCGNLDLMSAAVARTPGQDPVSFERDFFGVEVDDRTPKRTWRRAHVVVTKGAIASARITRLVTERAEATGAWWVESIERAESLDVEGARRLLADARERFAQMMEVHAFQSSIGQAVYGRLAKQCTERGHPGLELRLTTGHGGLEEVQVASDLWALAHDDLTMEAFLQRHGYHGPAEGELSSRSWREDSAPVAKAAAAYASSPGFSSPEDAERRQRADREAATRVLLEGQNRVTQARLRRLITAAGTRAGLREAGKAGFLKAIDVGRAAGRALGRHLAADGVVEDVDDVFLLTFEEAMSSPQGDLRPLVEQRRQLRASYERLDLPGYWTGDPEPVVVEDIAGELVPTELQALGVSAGVAEGRARVILDPASCPDPVSEDEILVAHTTDPSWVSLFMSAGGMVVDLGGALSHAAIVARELGVPCVINTGNGSAVIPDGALIRVDGSSGLVTILKEATEPA